MSSWGDPQTCYSLVVGSVTGSGPCSIILSVILILLFVGTKVVFLTPHPRPGDTFRFYRSLAQHWPVHSVVNAATRGSLGQPRAQETGCPAGRPCHAGATALGSRRLLGREEGTVVSGSRFVSRTLAEIIQTGEDKGKKTEDRKQDPRQLVVT